MEYYRYRLSNIFYTNRSVFLDINIDAENPVHIKLVTRNTFKSPRDSISLEFNFEDLEFSKLSEADIFPACKDSNDYRLPSAIFINPILIIFAFIFIRNKHNGKVKPFLIIIVFIVRTF